MRVLALGGSGGMGRFSSFAISSNSKITKVTIADLNESSAKEFARNFDERFSGIGIDVSDKEELEKLMQNHDIVLNTTGPFFKLGVSILKSAINCKCHYLDICDDWEPTLEMLNLNDAALKNGVTAIIGLGASPGISNLLGLKAMKELDSVSSVITGWDISSAKPEDESSQSGTNAAMEHGLQQVTGEIKIFKEKKFKNTKPLEKISINYPGRGNFNVYLFGHPEAITFPYHYKDIKESFNVCHGANESNIYIIKILRWLVDNKVISFKSGALFLEWLERNLGTTPSIEKQTKGLPAIYGLAQGTKNQKTATVAVTLSKEELINPWGMGAITGFPLAFGLELFLENKINQKGVFAPEGAIEPDEFFSLLTDHPLEISRSWEC